jgi:hypothetical protein
MTDVRRAHIEDEPWAESVQPTQNFGVQRQFDMGCNRISDVV